MSAPIIEIPAIEHVSRAELDRIVNLQRSSFLKEGTPSANARRDRIDRLLLAVFEHADALGEALDADYGRRSPATTKALEILGLLEEARFIEERLEDWIQPVPVEGSIPAQILQSPLGVVGILAAWNGPIATAVQPAIAALAAGNRVIIKTNDVQRRTGVALARAISTRLSEDEVAVVVGDLETTQAFSQLELDHLMFTGSPAVGRIVAVNAAKNLVPVTLELGGKNPALVSRSTDLAAAARKIATTRLINNGQACYAPDYAFVPREHLHDFVSAVRQGYLEVHPTVLDNAGVPSIVNEGNFERVLGLIEDALDKGATKIEAVDPVEEGRLPSRVHRLIAPTILLDVPEDARIAQNEVFGPVLAVYPYDDIDEAIGYINTRPSPLALYYYGEDDNEYDRVLRHTRSGGVTRNDGPLHYIVTNAPFGGVGNSGTGAYHGKYGFDEFSHQRTVATQTSETSVFAPFTGVALTDPSLATTGEQGLADAIDTLTKRVSK
ncbi:aldehyde dehydrogenase family protein [Rhodococcus sp. 14C212]|uniref:aldehyde dehydrogenase family protein n=1 Tax=Rhodococcus sp. 14C212 TaxID=2711209 RepID=UPI0013ED3DA1|nr:aldehyde dehydrogenase family protein [Rhodococcus sp. 14C212]NGP07411.1 aldehyde dehydrogenase family protein [Rhodococcus sp. 14C212]